MPAASEYLNRVISEYQNSPKWLAWIAATVQPFVDGQNNVLALPQMFALSNAAGDQLDKTGEWIGLTRFVTVNTAPDYFSFGVPGVGFGQGQWALPNPVAFYSEQIRLNDNDYRALLKARVLANNWDGTKDGAYAAWNALMNPRGFQVLIQNVNQRAIVYFAFGTAGAGFGEAAWRSSSAENVVAAGNMHILLAIIGPELDAMTQALFTGGYLDLAPAGVAIDNFATQSVVGLPIFAFGSAEALAPTYPPTKLAGFGIGAWAKMLPGT